MFAREVEHSESSMAMVQSIQDVAQKLKKPCVAEFVENEALATRFTKMGIEWGQGYYFHKPEEMTVENVQRCLLGTQECIDAD